MRTNRFQNIDSTRLTAEVRRSIHAQLFQLGQGPREVARRNGMTDRAAVAVALEVERERTAAREAKIWRDARLSALARPTIH